MPRSTLKDRLDGKFDITVKVGRKPLLTKAEETKLADFASNRAAMGYGFGKQQFLKYAAALATKYGRNFKKSTPSQKWWTLYNKRNKRLSLRQPEGTSSIRHRCMDPLKIAKYFVELEEELTAKGLALSPSCIWNMDETGLTLDHKPKKVVAATGAKHLQSCTSGNREMLTVIATINAAGRALPPHIIAKGKTLKALDSFQQELAPTGTTWSVSDTGWTKQGIASLWFRENFLKSIGDVRPQMLILDGHDSHNFVEIIELAIANQISLVELPAHTSHWLQPCDRTVFGPLKTYYNSACTDMTNMFPGTVVSRTNFCTLLTTAWIKAMTPENIKSGFRACGIYPFNPSEIPTTAYMPNSVYTVTQLMENRVLLDVTEDKELPVAHEVEIQVNAGEVMQGVASAAADGEAVQGAVCAITDGDVAQVVDMQIDNIPDANAVHLEDYLSEDTAVVSKIKQAVPPQHALNLLLGILNEQQLSGYKYCFTNNIPLPDKTFELWKCLVDQQQDLSVAPVTAFNGDEDFLMDDVDDEELRHLMGNTNRPK